MTKHASVPLALADALDGATPVGIIVDGPPLGRHTIIEIEVDGEMVPIGKALKALLHVLQGYRVADQGQHPSADQGRWGVSKIASDNNDTHAARQCSCSEALRSYKEQIIRLETLFEDLRIDASEDATHGWHEPSDNSGGLEKTIGNATGYVFEQGDNYGYTYGIVFGVSGDAPSMEEAMRRASFEMNAAKGE